MTRRDFLIQYTLNRAAAVPHSLDSNEVVSEAVKAWDAIDDEMRRRQNCQESYSILGK